MPLDHVNAGPDGRPVIQLSRPGEIPKPVRALQAVVLVGLILSLGAMLSKVAVLWNISDELKEQEVRLYQISSFDMDDTIDGRWRYCREHEDQCAPPWGDNDQGRTLFSPAGWEGIVGPAVRYQTVTETDSEGRAVDPGLDLADACDDGCAPYPLHGDYMTGMPIFVGREMLKLLKVTLNIGGFIGFLFAFYIIGNYVFILRHISRGHPLILSKVRRIAILQLLMEFSLWLYFAEAADTVYSLPIRYGFKVVFFVALGLLIVSYLPAVRAHCSEPRFVYAAAPPSPGPQPPVASATGAQGAPPMTAPAAGPSQPGTPGQAPQGTAGDPLVPSPGDPGDPTGGAA